MGEAAPKEPSMEDILASIRRIVSQDEPPQDRRSATAAGEAATEAGPAISPNPPDAPSERAERREPDKRDSADRTTAPTRQEPPMGALASLARELTSGTQTPRPGQQIAARPPADEAAFKPASPSARLAAGGGWPSASLATATPAKPESERPADKEEPGAERAMADAPTQAVRQAPQASPERPQSSEPAEADNPQEDRRLGERRYEDRRLGDRRQEDRRQEDRRQGDRRQEDRRHASGPAPISAARHNPTFDDRAHSLRPKTESFTGPATAERPTPQASGGDSEVEAFRGALVSPRTQSAVADSFERLKRSAGGDLDAKIESVLRPLLREWLDENLPAMVERLVRDEIERLARRQQ